LFAGEEEFAFEGEFKSGEFIDHVKSYILPESKEIKTVAEYEEI